MTVQESIKIRGCEHEKKFTWIIVDLDEPKKIGQPPMFGETPSCSETPLPRPIELGVKITGKEINDKYGKRAEVKISCPATDCPHHKKFKEEIAEVTS